MPITYDAYAEPEFVEYIRDDGKHVKMPNLNHPYTIKPTVRSANGEPMAGQGMLIYGSKKNKGHYYDIHGNPVPTAVAELAGFDVENDLAAKRKAERQQQALAAIEAEFRKTPETVIAEQSGYKLIDVGQGEAIIRGPDGAQLTPTRMSHETAKRYYVAMTAEVAPEGNPDDA